MPMPEIQVVEAVTGADADEVARLIDAAARADGVMPLSEHVRLHLSDGDDQGAKDLLLRHDGGLAGFAHLDPAGAEGPAGELVIHPGARRRGLGLRLTRALQAESARLAPPGAPPLRVWAHGGLPAAARLAEAAGFGLTRSLYQLRRPLDGVIDPPHVPDGVTVRAFEPGRDEEAWLAVNARAFAHHPEQGAWTLADLAARERQDWFDPAGFFLAERDGTLAGFHWTKVHPDDGEGDGPVGEVYVVGVDPAEQGTGLGKALTVLGLRYLQSRGLPAVMLYVDGDNEAAVALYGKLGFTRWHADLMYAAAKAAELDLS
jgi:mycothiol synthase